MINVAIGSSIAVVLVVGANACVVLGDITLAVVAAVFVVVVVCK